LIPFIPATSPLRSVYQIAKNIMKSIGSFFDKVWNWVVVSSANPSQTSLTVKGALATATATILGVLGAAHFQVAGLPDFLNMFDVNAVLVVQYALGIVGAVSLVVGAIRKLYLSFTGSNPVLTSTNPTTTP